jgi:hypothetical protein
LGRAKGGTQRMLDVGQLTLKPSTVQVTHHPQSYMHQTISFGCIQTLNPRRQQGDERSKGGARALAERRQEGCEHLGAEAEGTFRGKTLNPKP